MQEATPNSTIRFGVFQLDTRTRELYKSGRSVRLQDQPIRVLLTLLEQPGELVSREELRRRIWPNEDFGDFDHAVSVAVAKIRAALSDDADSPRFVETLPRRGYRFIFPVQPSAEHALPGSGAPAAAISTSEIAAHSPTAAVSEAAPRVRRASGRVTWLSALLVIVAAAGILIWRFGFSRPAKLAETDTVVLAEFANSTGEPLFDRTLRRGLGIALEQSPYLKILSDDQIEKTLGFMKRAANTMLTADVAREVCRRTSSAAVLNGAIDRVGPQYVIALRAINCQSGQLLGETEYRAADKNRVLDALGDASAEIRKQLGESIASVKKSDKPLAEASTSSIDALQAYTLAMYDDDDDAAMALFRRATALDPHFALAYLQIADMYTARGQADGAIPNFKKAFEFRTQASEWEHLLIESRYEENVTGNMERAHESYEIRARLYPNDSSAVEGAGGVYMMSGQYDRALEAEREAAKIAPENAGFDSSAVVFALFANRVQEAHELNARAIAKGLDNPGNKYMLAFVDNDASAMEKAVSASKGSSFEEGTVTLQSDTEAHAGHLQKSRELEKQVLELCEKKNHIEEGAEWRLNGALREAEFGTSAKAKELSKRSLELAPTRDVKILAAIALARAGDADRAEQLAEEVGRLNPQNTQIQRYWLPTARAAIQLDRKNPEKAIEALQPALDFELGFIYPETQLNAFLYPAYLRGVAFLKLGRPKEAASEFQKFEEHRTLVLNNPLSALAKLQIGRAYAMQGDATNSRAAYEDFLNLWKDADPDIPIFQQAKAEFAKLH
jgi:DNA-binding winged helix-turn-helix (wHTH) protein/tetratricopeptide (TPR) repeat protein